VFPVKDRKALLDEGVTTMIRETAVEIAERFPIARAALGTDQKHIPRRCRRAHPEVAPGRSGQIFKRITAREIFRRKPAGKQIL
jgi:putative transposase